MLIIYQNYRIIRLIEKLILIDDRSLNEIIKCIIIKGNDILKVSFKKNDEELVRLMEIMGETEEALDQTEELEGEFDSYFSHIAHSPVANPKIPFYPVKTKSNQPRPNFTINQDDIFNDSRSVLSDSENMKVYLNAINRVLV